MEDVSADGLFEEKLPPTSLGNRQIVLSSKINPPLLTEQTKNTDKYIQFALTDMNSENQTIPHVYYFVKVTKDDSLQMKELFHSHLGNITIKIDPSTHYGNTTSKIIGDREPIMGAWIPKNNTEYITAQAPILDEGGLYNFEIEILGIDNDTNIFKASNALTFESRLSVGDLYRYDIDYKNRESNVTIISYYDKIKNFSYSSEKDSFSWYMPFDWDLERLKEDENILVHNEIWVPKLWFDNSTIINPLLGKVNERALKGNSFVMDPFSSKNNLILHYVLTKEDLINFTNDPNKELNNLSSNSLMKFELSKI
jgi:hypothetical protein